MKYKNKSSEKNSIKVNVKVIENEFRNALGKSQIFFDSIWKIRVCFQKQFFEPTLW